MRNMTESRSTQTNLIINQPSVQQPQAINQQNELNVELSLSRQSSTSSLNSIQNGNQENNVNQNCDESTSSLMRIFIIVATFFMGLFDIILFLLSFSKKLIPNPLRHLFETKCNIHRPDDLCMNCTACQQTMNIPSRKFNENECAICMNQIKNKIFFSCYHSCCAECIIKYWEKNNYKKMKCIFCRKQIDMIYRDFKAEGDHKKIELRKTIRSYNSTFAPKDRSLISKIRQTPFLLQRTINFIFTREGAMFLLGNLCSSHYFIVGLLYIISPLDLLPECIFGIFGLLDDLVIMGILFVLLTNFYYRYLLRQDQEDSSSDSI